jgi:competence protein ComEA
MQEHSFRSALSRAVARVVGSRFAKPIARVALAAAGLVLLAFVGRTAVAGAIAASAGAASSTVAAPTVSATARSTAGGTSAAPAAAPPPIATTAAATATNPVPAPRTPAAPDDPVVLNAATEADLRRLPGIGAKRAEAILLLRTRVGHFRAVEDLLKVKGIGRATLKRLRPLIRLD